MKENKDWKRQLYMILNYPIVREVKAGGSGKKEDNGEEVYIERGQY
jgi:hypothetical protein